MPFKVIAARTSTFPLSWMWLLTYSHNNSSNRKLLPHQILPHPSHKSTLIHDMIVPIHVSVMQPLFPKRSIKGKEEAKIILTWRSSFLMCKNLVISLAIYSTKPICKKTWSKTKMTSSKPINTTKTRSCSSKMKLLHSRVNRVSTRTVRLQKMLSNSKNKSNCSNSLWPCSKGAV